MADLPVLFPAAPEMFMAVAVMAMMMAGAFAPAGRALALVNGLGLAALAVAAVLAAHVGAAGLALGGLFVMDPLAVFAKVLALGAVFLTMLMGLGSLRRAGLDRFEQPVLVCFAALGMMMMVSANDLMAMYLGLELQSLALYALAAMRRDSARAAEAGLKYFVLGAVASGLLLYGCSLIYGFAGGTGFVHVANALAAGAPSPGLVVGMVFVLAGLAFKISAVPFHMWTPDVYEGAPAPVTAIFAAAPKVAAVVLLVRLTADPLAALADEWRQVVAALAVLSMAVGAFAAIAQTSVRRLMAYSAIGHMGFALIGVAAGGSAGMEAALTYMAIYVVMAAGGFAVILCMTVRDRPVDGIAALSGLKASNPLLAAVFLLLLFSMAGIPPLAGFMGKLTVFMAAVEADMVWLAVAGAVSSVVSAFYYLRLVRVMYFDEPAEPLDPVSDWGLRLVLAGAAAVTLTLIAWFPVVTGAVAAAVSRLPL